MIEQGKKGGVDSAVSFSSFSSVSRIHLFFFLKEKMKWLFVLIFVSDGRGYGSGDLQGRAKIALFSLHSTALRSLSKES